MKRLLRKLARKEFELTINPGKYVWDLNGIDLNDLEHPEDIDYDYMNTYIKENISYLIVNADWDTSVRFYKCMKDGLDSYLMDTYNLNVEDDGVFEWNGDGEYEPGEDGSVYWSFDFDSDVIDEIDVDKLSQYVRREALKQSDKPWGDISCPINKDVEDDISDQALVPIYLR